MNNSVRQITIGLFALLIPFCGVVGAELGPPWDWVECIGGTDDDVAYSVQQTMDGGYVIAGFTTSSNGDMVDAGYHSGKDAFVAKVDPTGSVSWVKCIGGTGDDVANVIQQVPGGFVIAGSTNSSDGNMAGAGYHESYYDRDDAFVAVLSSTGSILGVKCIGGSNDDEAWSIQQISGGFIIGGMTASTDGDMIGHAPLPMGGYDGFIAALGNDGSVVAVEYIGGSGHDIIYIAEQIPGGFAVAGSTVSSDGNMTGSGHHGAEDAFVAAFGNDGSLVDVKCIGGTDSDIGKSLLPVTGGYMMVGSTKSSDGDMTGSGYHPGYEDAFVAALGNDGSILGVKCIGGSNHDLGYSIQQIPGGFLIAGITTSSDGNMTGSGYHGHDDAFVASVSNTGSVAVKCFGGSNRDNAYSLQKTSDGGFVIAGLTASPDGNMSNAGYHGGIGNDAFIAKISPTVSSPASKIGVFRDGFWILDKNGNFGWEGPPEDKVTGFGASGDVPIVADWDNDAKDNIGLFRDGFWILDYNGNYHWDDVGTGNDLVAGFGAPGDVPVGKDWNGDGSPETAVFRATTGEWIIDHNGNYQWDGTGAGQDKVAILGQTGDTPVAGDWDAIGSDNIGIFRDGFWILDGNGNFFWDGLPGDIVAGFGMAGDVPVIVDWNDDRKDNIGIFRDGFWILDYNGNFQWDDVGAGNDIVAGFGAPGDVPVPRDWNGDGSPEIAVYRDTTGEWIIDHNGNYQWDGTGAGKDVVTMLGQSGDRAVAGSW